MRGNRVARIVLLVAAVHVAVVSILLGPRNAGYLMSAAVSAALIWGGVFVLDKRKRQAGVVAGIIAGLVVQQVAYQVWKAELAGFWWPLAQFGALQFLVGYVVGRAGVGRRLREWIGMTSEEQEGGAMRRHRKDPRWIC